MKKIQAINHLVPVICEKYFLSIRALFLMAMIIILLPLTSHAAVGSISGSTSYDGTTTGPIYVGIFDTAPSCATPNPEPILSNQQTMFGSYVFSGLPDGIYYVGSSIDNGRIHPTGPWAIFGGCLTPTAIIISGGNAVLGIDLALVDGTVSQPNPFYDPMSNYRLNVSGDPTGFIEFSKDSSTLWYSDFSVWGGYISGVHVILPFATHSSPLNFLSPQVGQTWTDTGSSNGYQVDSTATVTSVSETVSVTAGTFSNCAKTVETLTYPLGYTPGQRYGVSYERWFCPGVGPAKLVMRQDDGSTFPGELISYNTIGSAPDDFFPLGLNYSWTFAMNGGSSATWTVVDVLDETMKDDLIVDFGPSYGLWAWMNNATWNQLHSVSPEQVVTGDIDGSGNDDVIVDFGPSYGLWAWMNNATWIQLHSVSPELVIIGDIDGTSSEEIIIDFGPTYGLWAWMNNATWTQLHSVSPEDMILGDIDRSGREDIIIDFGSTYGLWTWMNNATWTQLHSVSPEDMVAGDIDTNRNDDIIIDFGPAYGLWAWMNNANWIQIHSVSPELMVTGNIDNTEGVLIRKNSRNDIIIDFGPSYGLWAWMNNTSWTQLHSVSPEQIVTGDIDSNEKSDIIIDFGPSYGLWAWMNNATWTQLHSVSPEQVVTGEIDGN